MIVVTRLYLAVPILLKSDNIFFVVLGIRNIFAVGSQSELRLSKKPLLKERRKYSSMSLSKVVLGMASLGLEPVQ